MYEGEKVTLGSDLISTLFDAIKHGDEKHKSWLKEAIEDHFAGRPVKRERTTGEQPVDLTKAKERLEGRDWYKERGMIRHDRDEFVTTATYQDCARLGFEYAVECLTGCPKTKRCAKIPLTRKVSL